MGIPILREWVALLKVKGNPEQEKTEQQRRRRLFFLFSVSSVASCSIFTNWTQSSPLLRRGNHEIARLLPSIHTAQKGFSVPEAFGLIFLCHTGRGHFARSASVKNDVRVPGNRCYLRLKSLQR